MCDTKYCHKQAEIHAPSGAWLCEPCHERYMNEQQQAWADSHIGFAVIDGVIRKVAL